MERYGTAIPLALHREPGHGGPADPGRCTSPGGVRTRPRGTQGRHRAPAPEVIGFAEQAVGGRPGWDDGPPDPGRTSRVWRNLRPRTGGNWLPQKASHREIPWTGGEPPTARAAALGQAAHRGCDRCRRPAEDHHPHRPPGVQTGRAQQGYATTQPETRARDSRNSHAGEYTQAPYKLDRAHASTSLLRRRPGGQRRAPVATTAASGPPQQLEHCLRRSMNSHRTSPCNHMQNPGHEAEHIIPQMPGRRNTAPEPPLRPGDTRPAATSTVSAQC